MNRNKRLISCLLVLVLAVSLLPLSASAEKDFTQVLAETKKGVIQLYGRGENASQASAWTGTGFAIGKTGEDSDTFLTNWHCVTGSGEYDLSETEIWILQEGCQIDKYGYPESGRSIRCEVLKTTTGYPDYAIIRSTTKVEGYKALPLLSSEDVADGATVYALGYPGEVSDISASQYGIDDITATNGIISQHLEFSAAGNTLVLLHTAQIAHGNSGGPLITADGAVVGLNTYSYTDDSSRYMAVYIDYAMEGLDDLGISYSLYSEDTDLLDDLLSWVEEHAAAVLLCGILVLAGVLAAVLVVSQKQKAEKARLEAQHRQEEQRRLEEQRRMEESRRQEHFRQAQQPTFHLRCWNGRLVPIGDTATLGRDPGNTIVLPPDARGVSRSHCRLDIRNGQLILTDVGSSQGTLIHGKRIPIHTPVALRPGSSFCLGSEQYSFTVC